MTNTQNSYKAKINPKAVIAGYSCSQTGIKIAGINDGYNAGKRKGSC